VIHDDEIEFADLPKVAPPAPRQSAYGQAGVHRRPSEAVWVVTDDCETAYGTEGTETAYGLSGKTLAAWDGRDDFAAWVCERAGLRFEEEEQLLTVGDAKLRLSLWRGDRDGLWIFRVWEGRPESKRTSLSLTEVFAVVVTGLVRDRRGPEGARWKRRALVEAALVAPAKVSLAQLPDDAPQTARETWNLIADLLSIRRLEEPPGTPVALSAPWLSEWSGVSEPTIKAGKAWLERHGFIEHVADAPGSFGRPTFLWLVREGGA
jgi:hypothetical protein